MENVLDREYASLGCFGVAVPQANCTVEPEMAKLFPADVAMLVTRLQGSRTDSRSRFLGYLENLPQSLEAYDTAELDAVGFACTSTSYLIGRDEEDARFAKCSEEFGSPVVTSAQAVREALEHLNIKKIALFAPYPAWLIAESTKYWATCGLSVTASASVPFDTADTRNIYKIRTEMVMATITALDWRGADAILLAGTGMPTLRAIPQIAQMSGRIVLSSNLCLAWALLGRVPSGAKLPERTRKDILAGSWR